MQSLSPSASDAPDEYLLDMQIAGAETHVTLSRHGTPQWGEVAELVRESFGRSYGARPEVSMPLLLALRNRQGELLAAVGLRFAARERLFLENYLDQPIEQALLGAAGKSSPSATVTRREVVEVGHLAGFHRGMSRFLFIATTALLSEWQCRWIAFTGTREVRHIFRHLNLEPVSLGGAEPSRVPGGAEAWGSYYRHEPEVMVGDVSRGHRVLAEMGVYRMLDLKLAPGARHAAA